MPQSSDHDISKFVKDGIDEIRRLVGSVEVEVRKAVEQIESAVRDLAAHNLRRSEVRAPYTGQINRRLVTRGMHVEDKSVIATMADLSRLRLVGFIPEKSAPIARNSGSR